MKKYYKIIIPCVFVLIVLVVSIIVLTTKKKTSYSFITVPYDYFLEAKEKEDNTLSVPLYVDSDKSPYLNMDSIKKTYLTQNFNEDKLQIDLKRIEKRKKAYQDDHEYYEYCVDFNIPLSSNDLIKFMDVSLNFEYSNDEKISLPIGNLYLYPKYSDNLHYSSLKGLVRDDILQGVLIKFEEVFIITKITPMSDKVLIDSLYTKVYNEEKDIEELRPKEIEKEKLENCNFLVKSDYLFISLYNKQITPEMGFILNYIKDGEEKVSLIYPFKYYSTLSAYQLKKIDYEVPKD